MPYDTGINGALPLPYDAGHAGLVPSVHEDGGVRRAGRVNGGDAYDTWVRPGPLPSTAVALDRFTHRVPGGLHADEERLARGMAPGRRADFVAGRRAAARALAALGRAGPVVREGRRPLFPPGVRGSISHCVGHIGACVATTNPAVAAVGIDLERTDRLTRGTADLICTPRETRWAAAARRAESRLSVIFSAKEAVYKALSPLFPLRRPVFHDADIRISGNRLDIRVADDLLPSGHEIRGWISLMPGGYVMTATFITTRTCADMQLGHQPSIHFLADVRKSM